MSNFVQNTVTNNQNSSFKTQNYLKITIFKSIFEIYQNSLIFRIFSNVQKITSAFERLFLIDYFLEKNCV